MDGFMDKHWAGKQINLGKKLWAINYKCSAFLVAAGVITDYVCVIANIHIKKMRETSVDNSAFSCSDRRQAYVLV